MCFTINTSLSQAHFVRTAYIKWPVRVHIFPSRWEGGCRAEGVWGEELCFSFFFFFFYLIHRTVLGLHKHSGNLAANSSCALTQENCFSSSSCCCRFHPVAYQHVCKYPLQPVLEKLCCTFIHTNPGVCSKFGL